MRALALPFALALALTTSPARSETIRFIKVDVVQKSGQLMHHHQKHEDGPSEVHIRVPLSLAKGVLESFADQEIHFCGTMDVNGEPQKVDKTQKFKVDQLVKLLESVKPGDLLLEVKTDKGDAVTIRIE